MSAELDQVLEHFVKSLSRPFQIHDRISVHLDSPILSGILQRFEQQDAITRAGLLCSILPRKRMNELIKNNATELIELATKDDNDYIRTLALMASTLPTTGTINTTALDSIPEMKEFIQKCSNLNLDFVPEEIMYLSAKAQKNLLPKNDMKSKLFLRKPRPNQSERMQQYGIKQQSPTRIDSTPSVAKRHAPSSIFIPATPTSNVHRPLKTPTGGSARGFKKENKMKLLDMDEVSASIPSKHDKEAKIAREKAEKEAEKLRIKEQKDKEAEEKRLKAEEKKREREKKKRKSVDEDGQQTKRKRDSREEQDYHDPMEQDFDVGPADPLWDSSRQSTSITEDNRERDSVIRDTSRSSITEESRDRQERGRMIMEELNQPKIMPPKFDPVNVDAILSGADCLSLEDRKVIAKFLEGDYGVQAQVLEFKLTERVYDSPTGQRRECMYIVLDYSNCKWKKVKRTSKVT